MTPVMMVHLLQRSQHLTDLKDLIHFAVAREQRSKCVKLCHDASHSPDVDGRAVGVRLQQNLWGSVPVITARQDIYISRNFLNVF